MNNKGDISIHDWHKIEGKCPKCNQNQLEERESSGDYQDWNYRCLACKHSWWIDGPDA